VYRCLCARLLGTCGPVVQHLQACATVRTMLHRHVTRFYCFIGDTSPRQLLWDIWSAVTALQAVRSNGGDWERQLPPSSLSIDLHAHPEAGAEDVASDEVELEEMEAWDD
jgi:hypothetical protein